MKTVKIIIGLLIILIVISCSHQRKGLDSLVGKWGNGGDSIISFTKQDTTVLGILTQSIRDYNSNGYIEYKIGSVLFKYVKKVTDSTFVAKGLYIKAIYNTYLVTKPTIFNWGGDDGHGNVNVEQKEFDHFENSYVDYRLEVNNNYKPIENVKCLRLKCIPFAEGPKWEFLGNLSSDDKALIQKEQQRIADSIAIADSLAKRQAELERQKRKYDAKKERAKELLK